MKQFLALAVLIGCLYFSAADVATEEFDSVAHAEKHILSVQKSETRISIDKGALEISEETIQQFWKIVEEALQTPDREINVNEFVDSIISNIASEILLGNHDPADLPNQDVVFQFRPILITYTGTLNLSVGRLQDLSTVRRNEDATVVASSTDSVRISVPLSFRNIIASYNFLMNVRGDTATGVLYSWVSDKVGTYNVEIDLRRRIISSELSVDVGSLDIDMFGSGLSNTYRRLITDLTEDLLIQTIIEYSEAIVGGYLTAGFESALELK